MYQENSQIDQITVVPDGTVFIRNCTVVTKDDAEFSRSYTRRTLVPGSNISELPENVQSVCNASWTLEVVSAYKTKIAQIG
jgi:hypothetical protein